ncbi:ABC transporter substrate-binding protein [uncultured Desulfobacter sp.]|uniref:ABC transporter substrate-binding protein n=1 Tax=uncultured Desulfobacter sp. TaxID=240139 RepID=UPI0029F4753F|nr:ABC transporter substrate-binding protein [uncultured Desulfobacter sp.]
MMKNTMLKLMLIFMCSYMSMLGCDSKQPVKIGFIAGMSGRVADLGIAGLDAVQMLIEKENREGGINGHRIQLIIKDDRHDPEVARQAATQLINEGVSAIIGPMTSQMGMSIMPILNKHRMLCVAPTVSTQKLFGLDDYFFRVLPSVRTNTLVSADYQIKSGNMTRAAAIYDVGNRSYTGSWLENFEEFFVKGGGKIISVIPYNTKENNPFEDIANQTLSLDINGILIIANSMDSALLCQQIRKKNKTIYITLADWGATEQLLEFGGKAVEGVTVVQTFDREAPSPAYQTFRKAYMEQLGREPGFPGVNAYDAAHVVITALKRQKKGEDLKKTVLSIRRFEGLQGPLIFSDYGDMTRPNAFMSIVKNRKFILPE